MKKISKAEVLKKLRMYQDRNPNKLWTIDAIIIFVEAVDVPEDKTKEADND